MRQRLGIGGRIAFALVAVSLVTATIMALVYAVFMQRAINRSQVREMAAHYALFTAMVAADARKAETMAALVARLPQVGALVGQRRRSDLEAMFAPVYDTLRRDYGVRQFQFHLPPARSFLRLHQPDRYGDDLSGFRETVVKANTLLRPESGIEKGVAGWGVRGVVPLFDGTRHVGSVEFGLSFGPAALKAFKALYGIDVAVHVAEGGGFALLGTTFHPTQLSREEMTRVMAGRPLLKEVGIKGGQPLLIYARRIGDFSGRPVGVVELAEMAAPFYEAARDAREAAILVALLAVLVASVVGLVIARTIARPVRQLTDALDRVAAGDFSDSLAPPSGGPELESMYRAVALVKRRGHEVGVLSRRLEALNRDLEGRVERRTRQLDAANRELEAFTYSVSHDLRAPLRTIDGFSRVLIEDHGGGLDEQGRHYLERIRAGTQRMAQLIDDLLKLSRSTRGEIRLEPVDLSAMAAEVVGELREKEPERAVRVEIEPGLAVQSDPRFLRVVMENLLGNAWKYTHPKADARIVVGADPAQGPGVFFVKDNGVGFDMAYADKLFVPFQRLHGTQEFEGSGIGLSTVERIVRRLGGRVWAEAEEGEGATFYIAF